MLDNDAGLTDWIESDVTPLINLPEWSWGLRQRRHPLTYFIGNVDKLLDQNANLNEDDLISREGPIVGQELLQRWVLRLHEQQWGDLWNDETAKHLHTKLGISSGNNDAQSEF